MISTTKYIVFCFVDLMIIRATLVCAHRPISSQSGPKDQVNPSKNNSSSGHHNPTGEAEESREEKDPIKST